MDVFLDSISKNYVFDDRNDNYVQDASLQHFLSLRINDLH